MTDESKEEKQYGLVVPSKNRLSTPKPGNVFGEESGSDGDDGTDWVRKALRAEGEKNLVKKQTQLTMKRALKEDPTVYQYDEVYDDIERSKVEEKISKKTVEKRPKYIENLLKAADRRKREQEHRVERMVQKEREAEGAMFADKESFVTSAYRAKLEEFKKMEEEEKRMDRLEAIGDVTKQQDISGFYRHLYRQTVDGDKKDSDKVEVKKEDKETDKSSGVVPRRGDENVNLDGDDPQSTDSEENSEARQILAKGGNKRQYRKRMAEKSESSSESDSEQEETASKSQKPGKVEREKEEEKVPEKRVKLSRSEEGREEDEIVPSKGKRDSSNGGGKLEKSGSGGGEKKESSGRVEEKTKTESSVEKAKKTEPEAPKVSIWEKRTVGPVFEAALERYYARKAARSSG